MNQRQRAAGNLDAMRGEVDALTSARESLESHLMAFAAEDARVEGSVIAMDQFRARAEQIEPRVA